MGKSVDKKAYDNDIGEEAVPAGERKVLPILGADAVVEPFAVVVHLEDTALALTAMVRAGRFPRLAFAAPECWVLL